MEESPPRAKAWIIAIVLGLVLVLWAGQQPLQPGPGDPLRRLAGSNAEALQVLHGRLLSDPQRQPDGSCQVLLQMGEGRTELVLRPCQALQEGWRVRVSGRLERPAAAPHPLLAGPAERLARQGSWTRLQGATLEVLARPATPLADLRRRIAGQFLAGAGPERGGLLAALVLGSAVVPLPQELREAFRASGLSHALAASGFHLTVLLGAVLAMARPFGRSGRLVAAGGAIGLFLLLAGPQPSVVRAVLMGSLALGAREAGLRGRPLGLLALSAAGMLVLRPHWLQDVGFQLSVAATAGLLVTADPLESALRPALEASFLPPWLRERLGSALAPALAVPLAASLWTLPLQLLHFGVVPLWAVPANLLATPLLTPLTLGAMAAALIGLVAPPVQALLMPPLAWLAQALLALAQSAASLPLAQWHSGRPPLALLIPFSLGLLALVVPRPPRPLQSRALALALVMVACTLHLHTLRMDGLLLVQDGPRALLLARHQGRGALISSRADALSCRRAQRLATGLGLSRYDWLVLLDAEPASDPSCWQGLAGLVVAEADGLPPLAAGQRLASPGLAAQALTQESQALELSIGRSRWLLLPNRQALWSWRDGGRREAERLWLGFLPSPSDRRLLQERGAQTVWLSGSPARRPPLASGWQATGQRGFLNSSS
ncbi:MAG: ComEC/Rec2 family competence protein [Cyanobacteriota bacterium]|nr:ComEC/Rec2 family competence protein [Cyanobacteriota bacterium]